MRHIKKLFISLAASVFLLSGLSVSAMSQYVSGAIQVDGYFDDWSGIPKTDFFYNPDMRHPVGLFRDDEYLYVYIHMTENGGYTQFNGANLNIYADGYNIAYIVTIDGNQQPGSATSVSVRYQNGYTVVPGSSGYVYRPQAGSDTCEFAIPLSAFAYNGIWQPTGIDTDNISTFKLTAPNLGNQTAVASGTNTGAAVGVLLGGSIAAGGVAFSRKRKKAV